MKRLRKVFSGLGEDECRNMAGEWQQQQQTEAEVIKSHTQSNVKREQNQLLV